MSGDVEKAGWSARAAAEARHPEAGAAFGIVIRPLRPGGAHALAAARHRRTATREDGCVGGQGR